MDVREHGTPANRTSTGTVKSGAGHLLGFYVNSTTAGTIVLYDATSATNAISGTITPAVGFHRFPAEFATGLHVVLGGTIDVTFFYR